MTARTSDPQRNADGLTAIEGLGVDHIFLGFTAPTGDGGQLADLQLEAIASDPATCPGTPPDGRGSAR